MNCDSLFLIYVKDIDESQWLDVYWDYCLMLVFYEIYF